MFYLSGVVLYPPPYRPFSSLPRSMYPQEMGVQQQMPLYQAMSQAQPDGSVIVPSTIVGQWFLPNLEPYQYTSPQLQYTSNSMTDQGLWMSQPSVTQPLAPLTITEPTYFPNHVLGTEGASGPTMAYPRSMGPQHQYPAHASYPPNVRGMWYGIEI
ncbi:hypothetical protein J6590_040939 [Homalodisca vitripennis]|nr:hypothetical protein J6590_040939 [Homalodisca vitripennis]